MNNNFDYQILEAINNAIRTVKATPLNLGAVAGSGGGIGGPPGGYVLFLPQTRVAYDFDEAALSGFVEPGVFNEDGVMVSGSLLDNLNHIRYRLGVLESGGSIIIVDNNSDIIYYDVTDLHFSGDGFTVLDLGEGQIRIASSGGGGASPLTVDDFDGSTTIESTDWVTFSGSVTVQELEPGHALITVLGSGVGSLLSVRESDDIPTVTNVDNIAFSGATVTDLGNGDVLVTVVFPSGESPLTVRESDDTPIVNSVDNIAFSGANVTDLGGGDVLVTIIFPSGGSSDVETFLDLTDTPDDYIDDAGKIVVVNSGGTGLTFISISALVSEDVLHYYNDDLSDQVTFSSFTTTKTYSSGTLRLYYNGLRQRKGVHYIDDVDFTTFYVLFPTYSGDVIIVDYDYLQSDQDILTDSEGVELLDSEGITILG